ncbi:MAG: hypothetical protein MJZ65_04235 [Paludibacteraceae bacterium]|nr:hypothetical protein [Paludibacteraceae bacterium]
MKHLAYILPLSVCLLTACSTQKNTGASRTWHELKVIHNVQFNGERSYQEGMEAINNAHSDNFADILPLYPVSDHTAAEASASAMDQAIEKCRKSIKLHGIKARPKINPKKRDNAKYQNWLKSKEFNSQLYRAWFMLGQSEFHKGDFLGSVGTFRYVEKLYDNDPNLMAMCQLWVARAYGEMGWIYEAEDVLSKVKVDDLKRKNEPFYSAVSADILIKGQHYKEAIPYVKVAKQDERRKEYKPRFEYVLGQLYQANKQSAEARSAYKRTFQLHPKDVQMEFNARIRYAELAGDTTRNLKQLRQMVKLYKYRDHLDQLYGTMGNIYLAHRDTVQALKYYELGIAESTQNGDDKAAILVKAGDLYYNRYDYTHASPCYKEATQLLSAEHIDYPRVSHRSEVLDEVVVEVETVQLQDSLQHLGTLSRDEQLEIINRLIADIKEQERQDSIRQAEQAREDELNAERGGLQSVDLSRMVGNRTGEAANWYFYNPQLMRSGKQEFIRQWGNRPLEDNWRRLSKASVSNGLMMENDDMSSNEGMMLDSLTADSTLLNNDSTSQQQLDHLQPEFYLQQIPQTPEDYAVSNALIADALYHLIFLYRDKVGDAELSYRTWQDFCQRFPEDERMVELYYDQYLYALRTQNDSAATLYRNDILTRYPESAQAKIVADPNYFESLQRMANEQDSLYEATYQAYRKNAYATVKVNKVYADTNYPLSPLMPRLLFLNAIATAKTDGQQPFVTCLQDMVTRYPENELSAMAKDMLAMMGQGMEAQKGGTTSTLTEQRQAVSTEDQPTDTIPAFSTELHETSFVYIVIPNDEQHLNNLVYEVALYNFSQFLIKDFDLKAVSIFSATQSALEIAGFESIEEAQWYMSLLQENTELAILLKQLNAIIFPITETNLKLLNHPFTLDEYRQFIR